jgi:RNA polymerase sigma factor (sigma-70 family)
MSPEVEEFSGVAAAKKLSVAPPQQFRATAYMTRPRRILNRFMVSASSLEQACQSAKVYASTELRLPEPYSLWVSPAPGTESLESLLARIRPRLHRILNRFRIPYDDVEDLIQETLLAYVSKGSAIQSPEAWLATTLFNRCAMYWRSQHRDRRKLAAFQDHQLDEPLLFTEMAPRTDARVDLERLVRLLPKRQRELLRLRFVFELEPSDIAEIMGCHESSVRRIAWRALNRLAALEKLLCAEGGSLPER